MPSPVVDVNLVLIKYQHGFVTRNCCNCCMYDMELVLLRWEEDVSTAWESRTCAAVYELVSCVCGFCMKVGFSMLCSLFSKQLA